MISDAMTYPSAGKEASLWNAQDGYVQPVPSVESTKRDLLIFKSAFTTMLSAGVGRGRSSYQFDLLWA